MEPGASERNPQAGEMIHQEPSETEHKLAGVAEDGFAVIVLKVLIEPQTGRSLGHDGSQRGLANLRFCWEGTAL
jgi:hypothetical protein